MLTADMWWPYAVVAIGSVIGIATILWIAFTLLLDNDKRTEDVSRKGDADQHEPD